MEKYPGKGRRPRKSKDMVNKGTVNRGFIVFGFD